MLLRNPGRPRDAHVKPNTRVSVPNTLSQVSVSTSKRLMFDQRVALAGGSVASIVPRPETSGFRIVQYRVTGPRWD